MRVFDGLEMAVNLKIMQLQRRYPDVVFEAIEIHKETWSQIICDRMDLVLFQDIKDKDQQRRAFVILVEALAHLTFAPGGVECFGLKFEATFLSEG